MTTAALDGGPGTEEALEPDTILVAPEIPVTIPWYHRHKWGVWGEVFSANSAGLMGAFTGGMSGPWWQQRECVVCNIAQRRRVELPEDRTVQR